MSNLVPIKGNMPAVMAKALKGNVKEAVEDLSGGIVSGFPLISFRGKTWRVRKGGEESNYVDADGDAVQSIEVVILRANPRPSKLYYDKAYVEGDATPPKCWSADGIKPDKGVPEPQSKTCQSCPHNEWGSKITPQGTKTRACSDSRRLAVAFLHEIEEKGEDAHKLLLRVPAASLNPLKDYAEKVLAPKGALYFAVVTKIGFDVNAQFPKLTFKALRFLTDEEAEIVVKLREDEEVHRILAESIELAEAVKVEMTTKTTRTTTRTRPRRPRRRRPRRRPRRSPSRRTTAPHPRLPRRPLPSVAVRTSTACSRGSWATKTRTNNDSGGWDILSHSLWGQVNGIARFPVRCRAVRVAGRSP
jgi:hypothetical protein